jgi:hypothetical protein
VYLLAETDLINIPTGLVRGEGEKEGKRQGGREREKGRRINEGGKGS